MTTTITASDLANYDSANEAFATYASTREAAALASTGEITDYASYLAANDAHSTKAAEASALATYRSL